MKIIPTKGEDCLNIHIIIKLRRVCMVFITQQQHNTHSSKQDIFQLARDLGRYLNAMRRVNLSINRERASAGHVITIWEEREAKTRLIESGQ
jgi:hypothetical protein